MGKRVPTQSSQSVRSHTMSHRATAGLIVALVASPGQSPVRPRARFPRRRSMFSAIRWGAAALVLATFHAGAAQANLVTNPGFESGTFTGWALSGDTSFTFVDNFSPHSGRFGAFLGTSATISPSTGSITQTLATTVGVSYDIDFWLNTALKPNFLSVSFGGIVLDSLTDITTSPMVQPNDPNYKLFSYTALASSASTDLVFTFRHDPWGWDLDDVSVEGAAAVPEPGSLALVAGGLTFGFLLLALRRRRQPRAEWRTD